MRLQILVAEVDLQFNPERQMVRHLECSPFSVKILFLAFILACQLVIRGLIQGLVFHPVFSPVNRFREIESTCLLLIVIIEHHRFLHLKAESNLVVVADLAQVSRMFPDFVRDEEFLCSPDLPA